VPIEPDQKALQKTAHRLVGIVVTWNEEMEGWFAITGLKR